MNVAFYHLCQVAVAHRYFGGTDTPVVQFVPTAACASVLRNRGLLFKPVTNGFAVLAQVEPEQDPPVPVRPLDGAFRLSFAMDIIDKNTASVTEYTAGSGKTVFRFHNRHVSGSGAEILLSAPSAGADCATGADLVPLKPPRFEPALPFDASARPEIIDEYGSPVPAGALTCDAVRQTYRVDLSSQHGGLYGLRRGATTEWWYVDEAMAASRPFAVVDIYSGTTVPVKNRLVKADGTLVSREYTIRFNALPLVWQYLVVPRQHTDLTAAGLRIVGPAGVTFADAVQGEEPDGEVFIIESSGPVPLGGRPVRGMSLQKKKAAASWETLVADLPSPGGATIALVGGAGGTMRSVARMRIYM